MSRDFLHDDDGKKVMAKTGRPPKAPMTETEFQAILPILQLPRQTRGSSLDRAALEISLMRGLHLATDPRTRKNRTVSGRWVGLQLRARGLDGKKGLREKYGTVPKKHQVGRKAENPSHTDSRVGYVVPTGTNAEVARVQQTGGTPLVVNQEFANRPPGAT